MLRYSFYSDVFLSSAVSKIPSSFTHERANIQMGTYEVMFYNAVLVVIPAIVLAGVTGDLQKVFQTCRYM